MKRIDGDYWLTTDGISLYVIPKPATMMTEDHTRHAVLVINSTGMVVKNRYAPHYGAAVKADPKPTNARIEIRTQLVYRVIDNDTDERYLTTTHYDEAYDAAGFPRPMEKHDGS